MHDGHSDTRYDVTENEARFVTNDPANDGNSSEKEIHPSTASGWWSVVLWGGGGGEGGEGGREGDRERGRERDRVKEHTSLNYDVTNLMSS